MKLLVTAGATREPIDDVRFISNVSTGATGAALAAEFRRIGHTVTLLRGVGSVAPDSAGSPGIDSAEFSSAADLLERLRQHLASGRYDAVIMAAAVSDYRVDQPTVGKVSSRADEWVLRLVRNPKLLPQLKGFSPRPLTVIGFKLTSGADEAARRAAVAAQFAAEGVDAVVHNDLAEIRSNPVAGHPFWLYRARGVAPERRDGASALAIALSRLLVG